MTFLVATFFFSMALTADGALAPVDLVAVLEGAGALTLGNFRFRSGPFAPEKGDETIRPRETALAPRKP